MQLTYKHRTMQSVWHMMRSTVGCRETWQLAEQQQPARPGMQCLINDSLVVMVTLAGAPKRDQLISCLDEL